jgi:hypothetical protein
MLMFWYLMCYATGANDLSAEWYVCLLTACMVSVSLCIVFQRCGLLIQVDVEASGVAVGATGVVVGADVVVVISSLR